MSAGLEINDSNLGRNRVSNNNRVEPLTQGSSTNLGNLDVDDDVILLDSDWTPLNNSARCGINNSKIREKEESLKNDEILARRIQEDLDREFAESINNRPSPRPNIFGTNNRVRRVNNHIGLASESDLNQRLISSNEMPTRESRQNRVERTTFRSGFSDSHGTNSRDSLRTLGRGRVVRTNTARNDSFNGNETVIATGPSINTERVSRTLRALEETERVIQRDFAFLRDQMDHRSNRGTHRQNVLPMQFALLGRGEFGSNDYERLLRLDEINSVNNGLTKQEIECLPSFDFHKPTDDQDENAITCYICYEIYQKNEKLTILSCYHKYHKKCIEKWLKESRKCPLCKKDAIKGT